MKFDLQTLSRWKEKNTTILSCFTVEKGCAGTSISVTEGRVAGVDTKIDMPPLTIWIREDEEMLLSSAIITWTGKKWMLKSDSINTRCGCGTSFSLKSGNMIQDKIARMKLSIKQKKEGIHM